MLNYVRRFIQHSTFSICRIHLRCATSWNVFLQIDTEPFSHAVKRAAIDAENFGRTGTIATDLFDDVQQVTTLNFIE